MKKNSIKSKMLEYCYLRRIQTKELAEELQISPSVFAKSAIDQDISGRYIAVFLKRYHEISPDWLLLDEGSMLRHDSEKQNETPVSEMLIQTSELNSKDDVWKELVNSKNQIIEMQSERIRELQTCVSELRHTQNK